MAYAQDLNYLRRLLAENPDFANVISGSSFAEVQDPNEQGDSGAYMPPDFSNVRGGGSSYQAPRNVLRQMQGVPDVMPPATPIEQPAQAWQATPQQMEAPPPMNSMRTESGPNAGRTISLNFGNQPDTPQGPQPDYSQPIEIAGVGKGYWEKGGTGNAIVNGRRVMLGVDRDATMRRQAKEIALEQGRQNLSRGQVDMMRDLESIMASRAQRSVREDPTSQAVLEKKLGKAPEGMRWKADGSGLEPLPGGKPEQQGKKALELLDEADKYIDESTGSGIGAVADTLQGWFGGTNKGADAIARLRPIAGQLVAMMPRMEGPQSNYDVKLYQEMAGMIANPEIPVQRRKAAMQTIRQLNAKYGGGQPQAPGGVPEFADEASAAAAGLRPGTRVKIGGVTGTWR
jgi:hypothetical protein